MTPRDWVRYLTPGVVVTVLLVFLSALLLRVVR